MEACAGCSVMSIGALHTGTKLAQSNLQRSRYCTVSIHKRISIIAAGKKLSQIRVGSSTSKGWKFYANEFTIVSKNIMVQSFCTNIYTFTSNTGDPASWIWWCERARWLLTKPVLRKVREKQPEIIAIQNGAFQMEKYDWV